MSSDFENFESLRRLLALKRHEQPPPGYFNGFSRDVMARIKAGETGGEMALEMSWVQRLAAMFDVKPIFAGAFGTAVCALLAVGVISSEQTYIVKGSDSPRLYGGNSLAVAPVIVKTPYESPTSSTNPIAPSLFERFQPSGTLASERYYVPGN